jgi:hypothetical protein
MSTVRSEPLTRAPFAWSRIASAVAWIGGVFTTYLFVATAAASIPWYISLIAACVIQWVLTIAEKPLWRVMLRRKGGKFVILGVLMTCVDGVFNAAGIYPYVGRLAQTNVGTMLAEVLGVSQTMGTRASFLLAFVIGLVIAGLPEYLWEAGD